MEHRSKGLAILLLTGLGRLAIANPVMPANSDPTSGYYITEHGPRGAPISVIPTHNGSDITNPDGSSVTFSGTVPTGSTVEARVDYTVPGTINGLTSTDARQVTGNPGDPADPGILQFAAFSNGVMNLNPLGATLQSLGYTVFNTLTLPDFFPGAGQGINSIYYAVDVTAIGNTGKAFVAANTLGTTFTIGSNGGLAQLPQYEFSLTPLNYVQGSGFVITTPVPAGTQVSFIGYHDLSPIPEPRSILMLGFGITGILALRWGSRKVV